MKGRDGTPKVNVDQAEPPGAFVGAAASESISGEPPKKSKGPQRAKGGNFMAEGESQATSIKAARIPTHWRRGGFVQRKADGGSVFDKEAVGKFGEEGEKARRREQIENFGQEGEKALKRQKSGEATAYRRGGKLK